MAEYWMNVLAIEELELELEEDNRIRIFREREDAFQLEDRDFVKLFRLNKYHVAQLVENLEGFIPEPSRRSALSVETKVLAALRFFATGSYQQSVAQDINLAIHQTSVGRAITEVTAAINTHLADRWISFDLNRANVASLRQCFFERFKFPGVIGAIDCTHVATVPLPTDHHMYPERDYYNHKGYHSINVQLVCDANARILNVNARYPGRTHDAFIFANSRVREGLQAISLRDNYQRAWLLGDSGYPLEPWLMTPFEGDCPPGSPEYRYNRHHASARNVIERCNGILKSRWRCLLKHRTLHYMPDKASEIIKTCCVLHNICISNNIPLHDDGDVPADELGMHAVYMEYQEDMNHVLPAGRRLRNQLLRNYFANV